MVRKRNSQRSSCPAGWLQDGIKLPVHLTVRHEQYATRAVGIARSVFNLMVATHRSARAQVHGLWPSPMELEKICNELNMSPSLGWSMPPRSASSWRREPAVTSGGPMRTGAIRR